MKRVLRRAVAGITAALVALTGSVLVVSPASADEGVNNSGSVILDFYAVETPGAYAQEGTTIQMGLQLDLAVVKEQPYPYVVTYTLPEDANVVFPEDLGYTSTTESIESITRSADGRDLVVTFTDPESWIGDLQEALVNVNVQLVDVEETTELPLNFGFGGEPITIVIVDTGDEINPGVVTDHEKTMTNNGLKFSVAADGTVTRIGEGNTISYELFWSTDTAVEDATIFDVLDENRELSLGNVQATLTTWTKEFEGVGLAGKEGPAPHTIDASQSDNEITFDAGTLPANSELRITYDVIVSNEEIDQIKSELEAKYQDLMAEGKEGTTFSVTIGNDATFGIEEDAPTKKSAEASWSGQTPAVNRDEGMGKTLTDPADSNLKLQEINEDGTLKTPIDLTFKVTVDLGQFKPELGLGLSKDMIVVDTLPEGLVFADTDPVSGDPAISQVSVSGDTEAEIREAMRHADVPVGSYMIKDQQLFFKAGTDPNTSYTLTINTVLETVEGANKWTQGSTGYDAYEVKNRAMFYFATKENERDITHEAGVNFRDPNSGESAPTGKVNDPAVFTKDATNNSISAKPGEVAQVNFKFVLNGGNDNEQIKLSDATIVDHVDTSVFDVSDETIAKMVANATVTGGSDFTNPVLIVKDGNDLKISLSEEYIAANDEFAKTEITVPFYTLPIQGKKQFTVNNSATLKGSGWDRDYVSSTSSSVSSFGKELEIRKRVWDENTVSWNSAIQLDEDDSRQEFVYRIDLIRHNEYGNVRIKSYTDVIPDAFDVLGFVEIETGSGEPNTEQELDLGANVTAVWDDAKRELVISSGGERIQVGSEMLSVAFRVKLKDPNAFDLGLPIFNKIGGSTASIIPDGEGFPLLVFKRDALNPERTLTGGLFEITQPGNDDFTKLTLTANEQGMLVDAEGLVRLPEGTYQVEEREAPAGYNKPAEGQNTWTVTLGGDNGIVPFDIANDPKSYAIGDFTWIDDNGNGVQDEGEEPLVGVGVALYEVLADGSLVEAVDINGVLVEPTETDSRGRYVFDMLPAGQYMVQFTLTDEQAEEYAFTLPVQEDDAAVDSDATVAPDDETDGKVGYTSVINLGDSSPLSSNDDYEWADIQASEGIDPTWDAGVVKSVVSVGDYVWFDQDKDGKQGDPEREPGIPGVKVTLKDAEGNVVDETTTDENGYYGFRNLKPETDYRIEIEFPEGYTGWTQPEQGDDRTNDSNVTFETPTSVGVIEFTSPEFVPGVSKNSIEPGEADDPTLDAGVIKESYAIGDFVWIDEDRDGVQDAGEEVLQGVKVELFVVDEEGAEHPATDIYGNPVAAQETDENGNYLFDNLPSGTYVVHFTLTDDQAKLYEYTTPNQGMSVGDDSDAIVQENPATGKTAPITLDDLNTELVKSLTKPVQASEGVDPTWDAGVVRKSVSVGDLVWVDENRDGIQDPTEPGIPGVKLEIVDEEGKPVTDVYGKPVEPTVTDEDGKYSFDDLPAGKIYTVRIVQDDPETIEALKPYVPTKENGTDDPEKDSSTWEATSKELPNDGDRDPSLDFGFVTKKVSVGDFVWVDENRDGIQDPTEPGIPGVKLEIVDEEGNPVTNVNGEPVGPEVTDENGKYSFDELPAGKIYTVRIVQDDPETIEALKPYVPTKENGTDDPEKDSSTWEATSKELPNDGDRDPSLDFGFVTKTYAIGDVVWIDANNDGLQDDNENTLSGVTVILTDEEGTEIARTKTDEKGLYKFDNLEAGTYKVQFVLTPEQAELYEFTSQDSGDEALDSDADPVTGWTRVIVLDDSNTALTNDYLLATIEATQGIDPTWDAGVVLKPVTPGPVDPTDPEEPKVPVGPELGDLSATGATGSMMLTGLALMLMMAGVALMVVTRRRARA